MLQQKRKVIGRTTYLVTQMDGIRALETQTKLLKIVGPAIGPALTADQFSASSIIEKVSRAFPAIMVNFDDEYVKNFILSLFDVGVFREGPKKEPIPVDFITDFAGKIGEMWKVAFFILEVNFNLGKYIKLDSLTMSPETEKTDMTN